MSTVKRCIISIDVGVLHLAVIKVGFWKEDAAPRYRQQVLRLGLFDVKNVAASRQKADKSRCQFQHQAALLQEYLGPFCSEAADEKIEAVVIEQQFGFGGNANNIMKCLSHRIHQFFIDYFLYALSRTDCKICFQSPRTKFKISQLPASILDGGGIDENQLKTKPLRKKYAVHLVEEFICEDTNQLSWNDTDRAYFQGLKHSTNKTNDKRDDIADVILQALAYYERNLS
jgi:hypothetical protein